MSRTALGTYERAEIAVPCAYCGAAAGDWCETVSGRWATFLHCTRWRDASTTQLGEQLAGRLGEALAAPIGDP